MGTTVSCPVQWNLYSKDTMGTTVSSPVQWNLCSKDTIGNTVSGPVQWNLCSKDTIGTTVSGPYMKLSLDRRVLMYTCQCKGLIHDYHHTKLK